MNFKRNVAYDSRIRKAEATIGFADITAAGMTKTLDLAAFLLPADAYLIGTELNVTDDFDDGSPGSATNKVDIGINGSGTIFLVGASDNLGTIARTNGGTAGTTLPSFQPATQVRLTFTGSANLSTLTKGSVKIRLFYVRTDFLVPDGRN
jgi:hypothetical protein